MSPPSDRKKVKSCFKSEEELKYFQITTQRFTLEARKRHSSEAISNRLPKIPKMSSQVENTLKDFAKKKLNYSLDHLSKKALHAIVQGEPSPKGIQRQHLEPIIRFLLK